MAPRHLPGYGAAVIHRTPHRSPAPRLAAAALLVLLGFVTLGAAPPESPGRDRVLVVRVDGVISPVSAEALEAAIERANRQGYRALVMELDTPGGLETSMRVMVRAILGSRVPVIAWVTPAGAHAASAGMFLTIAADVAAMAPGTNIGAATPVGMQGGMDSTLSRKAANDAAAFARTIALQRGRNPEWAERAVRDADAISDDEAVRLDVVDFTARTLPELLEKADALPFRRGDETRTLAVRGLPADRIEPSLRQRLLAVIADPNVAYLLLMIGFYGLLFELQNPGAILPGIVGGISLILAFLALSTLPVSFAGIALIVLGIAFFLAEIKVMSHGLLAVGGIVAFVLGSLILFRGEVARVSLTLIALVTLTTFAFFAIVVGAGIRSQRARVRSGAAGMVGSQGEAVERLAPEGMVRVGGELWRAIADGEVHAGGNVEITAVEGLTLRVRPVAKEART